MLAVIKKRWKPKRAATTINATNINNNNHNNNGRRSVKSVVVEPTTQLEAPPEKIRVSTSPRQVHPLSEKVTAVSTAPNICVQGGRIEFIKPHTEKVDPVKEKLEARIAELEAQLEEEKKSTLKERRNTARFQALIEDRESLARDVEYERGARSQMESRLQEATSQADTYRTRIHSLQANINRLEESLRSMSQYKHKYAQLKLENASLSNALETRMQQFQSALNKLSRENESLKVQLRSLEAAGTSEERLAERVTLVERENERLVREREQCELCLDQVAHQVVKALLAQKGLREEVCTLRDRVKELETQNRALSSLLLQQIPKQQQLQSNNSSLEVCVRPVSCDESKLRWADSLLWVPIHRPRSLNLDSQNPASKGGGENHKDEGYSTMSSEAQGECGASSGTSGPLERLQEETTPFFLDTPHSSRVVDDEVVLSMRVLNSRQSYPPVRLSRAMLRSASDSQLVPYGGGGGGGVLGCPVEDSCAAGCDWWDTDCVQHWLRLEETRSAIQQQIEYDTTAAFDLEEWPMDDMTPGLSSIAESGAELEELWCGVIDGQYSLISPGGDSWSSNATSEDQSESKRSSTMSDQSDSLATAGVGTDFTRDFYRLVKFESTKSLASTSSRSQGEGGTGGSDREQALQSVLHFIVEQQQYCRSREVSDSKPDESNEAPQNENIDSGMASKSGEASNCEDTSLELISRAQGLLTVPEEDEEPLTSTISTPETVLREPSPLVEEVHTTILNFDQKTTSKQVIEELNKMIREDDADISPQCENVDDEGCCPTGWVHVERDVDLDDPKARANLLDVMMSSRSSSSCSGSSEGSEEHGEYQHLHRIHKSRRHKKASATREGAGALRRHGVQRVSIVGREDLFLRYGSKEKEAIASFDFLDELTSASSRESTTCRPKETLQ